MEPSKELQAKFSLDNCTLRHVPTEGGGKVLSDSSYEPYDPPVSDEVRDIFFGVNQSLLCGILSLVGIFTNIVNMCVFSKIGFQETINISLFGLAISDLCSLVTLLWLTVLHNPLLLRVRDLPFRPIEVEYMTAGWPHAYFFSITGWITAFVTFERFLCIAKPLKVKAIITPNRVKVVICFIFFSVLASVSPTYYTNRLTFKFDPEVNRTVFGLVFTSDRARIESITFFLNQVICPIGALSAVLVFTSALVVKLREKSEWRVHKATSGAGEKMALKDGKVAKMMITVSSIFIVSSVPNVMLFLVWVVEPEFEIFNGKYKNLCFISFSFANVLEAMNSSINIVVYYKMSSKYKAAFDQIMCQTCLRSSTVKSPQTEVSSYYDS